MSVGGRQIGVSSSAVGGTDRVWLGHLGLVQALKWSSNYPGGDATCSLTVVRDPRARHRALRPGRWLSVWAGPGVPVWQGVLSSPQPQDSGWALTATGMGSLGNNWQSLPTAYTATPTGGNVYLLKDVVDEAISRGLPWSGYVRDGVPYDLFTNNFFLSGWPNPSSTQPAADRSTQQPAITDIVNLVMDFVGYRWTVDRFRRLCFLVDPTKPAYQIVVRQPPARTANTYYTHLIGQYTDPSGNAMAVMVGNDAAVAAGLPRVEGTVLLGKDQVGQLTSTQATAYLQSVLNREGYGLAWSAPFVVGPGDLWSLSASGGSLPVGSTQSDVAFCRAGQRFRPIIMDSGLPGNLNPSLQQDFTAGKVEIDADTYQASISPVQIADRSLTSVLGDVLDAARVGL